jgi:D-cysteine desulfhydrase
VPTVRSGSVLAALALLASSDGCRSAPKNHAADGPLGAASAGESELRAKPIERTRPVAMPLFAAYPILAKRLPHVSIGHFPTPVEELPGLARRLGAGRLFVKRDDLSARAYGGGNVRKLEFLLGDAKRRGKTKVITTGSAGSNQAVATAIHGRALGLDVLLVLAPEQMTDHVRENQSWARLAGAKLRSVGSVSAGEALARRMLRGPSGSDYYFIETGGSSELGNVGFVNAGFELAAQVAAGTLPRPDAIYIALGTMGSAVGLCIGLKAAGLRTRVIGVRASNPTTSSSVRFRDSYARSVAYLRGVDAAFPALELEAGEFEIEQRELGPGYARSTPAARDAARLFGDSTGIPLETTYTGKALAALIRRAPGASRQTLLFWNTHASQRPALSSNAAAGPATKSP